MEEKLKVDENLIDQLVNDFINEKLNKLYELSHTKIYFTYNKFDFYLKAEDLLRPKVCIIGNSYYFNKHNFLNLNTNNVMFYSSLGKEKLFNYFNKELLNSKTYQNYFNRLNKYRKNDKIAQKFEGTIK